MKKILSLALCCTLLVSSLCGCSITLPWQTERRSMVMTVSGADVGSDLYAYVLTLLLRDPSRYNIDKTDRSAVEDKAVQLCTQYVAINTAFQNEGLRLSAAYKKQIADNVSTKWSFYRNYYASIGVTKQTLTEYETIEARRAQMITYLYGKGGAHAVSDAAWNAYYAVNYVTFRAINGYLTQTDSSGKTTRLPEDKIKEAETLFSAIADAVRGGTSMEDVCHAHADDPYILSTEAETVTINRDTSNYPKEFFTSVQKMDENGIRVIETSDYIFLVVKQSAKKDEAYEAHRLACLQEMCRDDFDAYLQAMIDGFHVQKDSSALGSLYGTVSKKF